MSELSQYKMDQLEKTTKEGWNGTLKKIICFVCYKPMKLIEWTTTEQYWYPFKDEKGVSHHHDNNMITGEFICENKHTKTIYLSSICQTEGCMWNRDADSKILQITSFPDEFLLRKEKFKEEKETVECPKCKEKSMFSHQTGFSTRIQFFPFEDESGPHLHDKNHEDAIFVCKNNHKFHCGVNHICPNPKCDWVQSDL